MSVNRFEDIYWHDGQLVGCSVSSLSDVMESTRLQIHAVCFESAIAGSKLRVLVTFESVKRFLLVGDSLEMSENFRAGNIYAAGTYGQDMYRFNLMEGYIEVQAGSCKVVCEAI